MKEKNRGRGPGFLLLMFILVTLVAEGAILISNWWNFVIFGLVLVAVFSTFFKKNEMEKNLGPILGIVGMSLLIPFTLMVQYDLKRNLLVYNTKTMEYEERGQIAVVNFLEERPVEIQKSIVIRKDEYHEGHVIKLTKQDFTWEIEYLGEVVFTNPAEQLELIKPFITRGLGSFTLGQREIDEMLKSLIRVNYTAEDMLDSRLGDKLSRDLERSFEKRKVKAQAMLKVLSIRQERKIKFST